MSALVHVKGRLARRRISHLGQAPSARYLLAEDMVSRMALGIWTSSQWAIFANGLVILAAPRGIKLRVVETRFWGTGMQSLNSRNGARSTLIVIDAATEHSWEADCG